MKRLFCLCLFGILLLPSVTMAQDATQLFYRIRDKVKGVNDYVADVRIKLDVPFMKVPPMKGKLYFKNPDKMKLERQGGISILPRNSFNLTMNNLLPPGNVTVIDGGFDTIDHKRVRVIKVIPGSDTGDIVLTRICIDEARMLVLHTETTTRDNGTINMDLYYNSYVAYSLPDKVIFHINLKDYKLPKGVTMDYTGTDEDLVQKAKQARVKKGRVQIEYLHYTINTGLTDAFFTEKK